MNLELWFRVLLSAPTISFRQTDTILSNFRRHQEAKSSVRGLKVTYSPFYKEQSMLFDCLKPKKATWSYFDLLEIDQNETLPQKELLSHVLEKQKTTITNKRLFQLAKENGYAEKKEPKQDC